MRRVARIGVRSTLPVLLLTGLFAAPQATSEQTEEPVVLPNIILIITDNQRWDTLWAMPNVQADLAARGITFTNAFVVDSLCCPARASILTGQYPHRHKVYANIGDFGGYDAFKDGRTLPKWLNNVGYRTGLFGKYLNGYDEIYVPPGWDYWAAFLDAPSGADYYTYDLLVDDTEDLEDPVTEHYGNEEMDYSTDVLAAKAREFIFDPANEGLPLFMMVTPKAPHTPTIPCVRYQNEFDDIEPYRPPSFLEEDVSDKPQWIQDLPLWDDQQIEQNDEWFKDQLRTQLCVDDMVGSIVGALEATGRIQDSLIVFTSDGGGMLGEHRWARGQAAYEESIRIPMVVRWDSKIATPRSDDHLVLNIDLGPTFASAARTRSPRAEGVSMTSLFVDPFARWRDDFLVEHMTAESDVTKIPTFCAVRSALDGGFTYVQYVTGEEELYDLAADPYQLTNVAGDPGYASKLAELQARKDALCVPPPPGWPGG